MAELEFITVRNHYLIYRKIVNNHGYWYARHEDDTELKRITYQQALGYEPLDRIEALQMKLGRMLLPH